MSTIELDAGKIRAGVGIAVEALAQNPFFKPLEVIFALSEACGRVIAAQEGTAIVHNDLLKHAKEHMTTTVRAAHSARGNDPRGITQ